jgi:CheY-like chemotaxis protein
MRILLVDDDENNLDIQSRIIKKLGYDVDSVSTGEDGVQRALGGGYGLIFLGISGAEAVVAIRNKEKSGFRIPIIALTGISEDFEYADYGFDDIMTKPISIDDFRAIFKKWLPNS